MSLVSKFLLLISRPAWRIESSGYVPSNREGFQRDLRQQFKTALRYLKRRSYMLLRGQSTLKLDSIPAYAHKILWINLTAPSLGDALMDTAGRLLLRDRSVTLLTDKKNLNLFKHDPHLQGVFEISSDSLAVLSKKSFDLALLDSFSPKSLAVKVRVGRSLPFVGLYGFLNAYEVHRTIYSFRRIEWLLRLAPKASPALTIGGKAPIKARKRELPAIAIAIGGEWEFRTYRGWIDVLRSLTSLTANVYLFGSANGVETAADLEGRFRGAIYNFVGKTSLDEVVQLMTQCDLFVGADGGLWHIASACGVPSVALHADCQLYDEEGRWCSRAGATPECIPLNAKHSVNEIPPAVVVDSVLRLLSKLKN